MTKTVVLKLYEALNARDTAAVEALLADGYTEHHAKVPAGKEGFFARSADFLADPGIHFQVVECFENGDGRAVVYAKAKKDGVTVFRTADVYAVDGGKVTDRWSMRQKVR